MTNPKFNLVKEVSSSLFFLVFVIVFFGTIHLSISQELIETYAPPPPPQVSSIGNFVANPVNELTGTPEISIPVITLKTQNLVLPITIDYSTTNIRVSDFPGNAGFGWSLNSGGAVGALINGLPDAHTFRNNGVRNGIPWQEIPFSFTTSPPPMIEQAIFGDNDLEPDLFYFSFPGGSGQFVIKDDGDVLLLQEGNLKIERPVFGPNSQTPSNPDILTWIITDDSGIKYYYGGFSSNDYYYGSNLSKIYGPNFGGNSFIYANSWYLRKIESPVGDFIEFRYEDMHPGQNGVRYWDQVSFMRRYNMSGQAAYLLDTHDNITPPQTINFDRRLSKIITSTGESVELIWKQWEHDTKVMLIEEIITNRFRVDLDYSLMNNEKDGNRPKLNKVTFSNRFEPTTQSYSYLLDYNDHIAIPGRTSFAQDLWGYYNGKNSNTSLIPSLKITNWTDGDWSLHKTDLNYNLNEISRFGYSYDFCQPETEGCHSDLLHKWTILGANREVDPNYLIAGTLKSITYPTGGRREFEFESHSFSWLREKQVEIKDFFENHLFHLSSVDVQTDSQELSFSEQTSVSIFLDLRMDICFNVAHYNQRPYFVIEKRSGTTWQKVFEKKVIVDNFECNKEMVGNFVVCLEPGDYKFYVSTNYVGSSGYAQIDKQEVVTKHTVLGGGLRIKKVTMNPISSTPLEYFYEYTHPSGKSSGVLSQYPIHVRIENPHGYVPQGYYVFVDYYNYQLDSLYTDGCSFRVIAYGQSVARVPGIQLPTIAYKRVAVTTSSPLNGRIVHLSSGINPLTTWHLPIPYAHHDSIQFGLPNMYPHSPVFGECFLSYEWTKPNEVISERWDETDNMYVRSTNELYNYTSWVGSIVNPDDPSNWVQGLRITSYTHTDTYNTVTYYYKPYFFFSSKGRFLQKKTKRTVFRHTGQGIASVVETEEYFRDSPYHNYITRTITNSSDEEQVYNLIYYPQDINNPPSWVSEMINSNILNTPLSKQVVKTGSLSGRLIDAQIAEYSNYTGLLKPYKLFVLNADVDNFISTWNNNYTFNTTDHLLKSTYSKYDIKGNVNEVINLGNRFTTVLWGYNYLYPIAVIENADYNSVIAALGTTSMQDLQGMSQNDLINVFNNLRSALPNASITSYTYVEYVGIRTISDPRGLVTTFFYDKLGRLDRIQDHENKILEQYQYHYAEPSN